MHQVTAANAFLLNNAPELGRSYDIHVGTSVSAPNDIILTPPSADTAANIDNFSQRWGIASNAIQQF
ncbi:MAG TPA: hypothetical protein VFL15_11575, partial [Gammaproteobacteria bacterium]|nr:hypothetical protein [Gammaproteobacteria bacterium]